MSTQTAPATNVQATQVPSTHNQDQRFNVFHGTVQQIQQDVSQAAAHMRGNDEHLYSALSQTLDLGLDLIAERANDKKGRDSLKEFIETNDKKWSNKNNINPFHGLVDVAFDFIDPISGDVFTSPPTLSKYRLVLRFAHEHGHNGADLKEDLEKRSFTKIYEDAVKHFSRNPLDHYVQDVDERFERAAKDLALKNGPQLTSFPAGFDEPAAQAGFVSAIMQVDNNGQYSVVGFEEETEQSLKQKVISLVPAEATRSRVKLREKNLYWLYVASDFYTRFLPSISDQMAWDQQTQSARRPDLPTDATDEERRVHLAGIVAEGDARRKKQEEVDAAIIAQQSGGASASQQGLIKRQKFISLNALQLTSDNDQLSAHSLTTHPSTPCVNISGVDLDDANWANKQITFTDIEAKKFSDDFLLHRDLSDVWQGNKLVLTQDNNTPFLDIEDKLNLVNWRTLDPNLTAAGQFDTSNKPMLDLRRWKEDFASEKGFGRKAFQSMQMLEATNGNLELVFPNDKKERRSLGALRSGLMPASNASRFFDFKNVIRLLDFAYDYGITYELDWLNGYQGASALRFHTVGLPFEASITLPMLLSMKGGPVEITL